MQQAPYKFIRKPQVVEALPWLGNNAEAVREFCKDEDGNSVLVVNYIVKLIDDSYRLYIDGNPIDIGEWIVKSGNEFTVCGAVEFNEWYDAENG